jgi:hypothetical protein
MHQPCFFPCCTFTENLFLRCKARVPVFAYSPGRGGLIFWVPFPSAFEVSYLTLKLFNDSYIIPSILSFE